MVEFITVVYLIYSFIAFYFLFLFLLIYFQNKQEFFSYPKPDRDYELTMVIPCYNGEGAIGGTIQGLVDAGYRGLKKIIVVDDCSKDNSYKIMKEYEKNTPNSSRLFKLQKTQGMLQGLKITALNLRIPN